MSTSPIKKLTINELHEALDNIQINVTWKGRTFSLDKGTGAKVKMKDFVKRATELPVSEDTKLLKERLIVLDLKGRAKLENSSFLTRFFARLSQIFGNLSFSHEKHIEKLDTGVPAVLNDEQEEMAKKCSKDFGQLNSEIKRNFEKGKKMVETAFTLKFMNALPKDFDAKHVNPLIEKLQSKAAALEKELTPVKDDMDKAMSGMDNDTLKGINSYDMKVKTTILRKTGIPFLLFMELLQSENPKDLTQYELMARHKEFRPLILNTLKMTKYY